MADVVVSRADKYEKHIPALLKHIDVRGLSILEIGRAANIYVPQRFEQMAAAKVHATNIAVSWPESQSVSEVITKARADTTRSSDVFGPNSFDLVFGIGVRRAVKQLRGQRHLPLLMLLLIKMTILSVVVDVFTLRA